MSNNFLDALWKLPSILIKPWKLTDVCFYCAGLVCKCLPRWFIMVCKFRPKVVGLYLRMWCVDIDILTCDNPQDLNWNKYMQTIRMQLKLPRSLR